jgi:hypothetical protein
VRLLPPHELSFIDTDPMELDQKIGEFAAIAEECRKNACVLIVKSNFNVATLKEWEATHFYALFPSVDSPYFVMKELVTADYITPNHPVSSVQIPEETQSKMKETLDSIPSEPFNPFQYPHQYLHPFMKLRESKAPVTIDLQFMSHKDPPKKESKKGRPPKSNTTKTLTFPDHH